MGASLGGGDDDEGIVAINITPFVDIILVVLIIFMVTTTTIVNRSIKMTLPEAATGESVDQKETISLAIQMDAQRQLSLDGEPITWEALRARVRAEKARSTETDSEVMCLIGADTAVPHGEVVKIIDLVRQEGIAKFAINIDPQPLPPEAAGAAGPSSAAPSGPPG